MSLGLSAQPGFTDIPDSTWDAGATLSTSALKSLNAAAKFAAVRNEQFFGYYKNGETVNLPVSPADGYTYQLSELVFAWSLYSTASHAAALAGTQTPPTAGGNSGAGTLLGVNMNVSPTSGLVTCVVAYFTGTTTATTDGILMVVVHAQRNR